MTSRHQRTIHITVNTAVEESGLSRRQFNACIARSLVAEPLDPLDLQDLRRVRRLQELGVNMAGVEIILRMRARIERLTFELARQERLRVRHEGIHSAQVWQRLLVWEPERESERFDGDATRDREY